MAWSQQHLCLSPLPPQHSAEKGREKEVREGVDTPRRSSRRPAGCLQDLKQRLVLYGEFIPCLPLCHQRKTIPHLSGFFFLGGSESAWDWKTLNLRGLQPCVGNALLCVVYEHRFFCRQCRKQDAAVSWEYKGNAQSTPEASSLLDRVRRAQWICLFYPIIKWMRGKGVQEPAIFWLECVYMCVCVCGLHVTGIVRGYQCLYVCMMGVGAAGLLYHSPGWIPLPKT